MAGLASSRATHGSLDTSPSFSSSCSLPPRPLRLSTSPQPSPYTSRSISSFVEQVIRFCGRNAHHHLSTLASRVVPLPPPPPSSSRINFLSRAYSRHVVSSQRIQTYPSRFFASTCSFLTSLRSFFPSLSSSLPLSFSLTLSVVVVVVVAVSRERLFVSPDAVPSKRGRYCYHIDTSPVGRVGRGRGRSGRRDQEKKQKRKSK